MGPRVISKTVQFDFNRETLYGDERMKFLVVKDNKSFKGLKLFKTFLNLFCSSDIHLAVLSSDGPIENLLYGIKYDQGKAIVFDEFTNNKSWNEKCSFIDTELESLSSLEGLLCIHSLTTLLIHNNVNKVYKTFHKILNENPKLHILALMHSDAQSLKENEIINSLATAIVNIYPVECSSRFSMTVSTRNKAYGQQFYDYQILPDFTFETVKVALPKSSNIVIKKPDPTANLTFNLNLNDKEKEARSQVQLPYTKDAQKTIIENLEEDYYDEEDPDDDLGYLESA